MGQTSNVQLHPAQRSPLALAVAGVLAMASGHAASPDPGAANRATPDLEEIIVTASRREQRVLDVPYNISAISGAQIESLGITNSVDLLRSVPGVSVVDRGYRNDGVVNGVRIRGVNVDSAQLGDYLPAGTSPVSTYINDTPLYANFLLKDVERVEVLRGPQGTLYGSGSLGGTVRYILREPELGKFSGTVSATASQTKHGDGIGGDGDLTLNIPLGDRFALRGTVSRLYMPGIIDYPNLYQLDANGIPVAPNGILDPAAAYTSKQHADDVSITYGRASLLWKPSDAAKVVLSYAEQKDGVGGRRQTTPAGATNYALGGTYGDYQQGAVILEPSHRDVSLTSLEATVDLGFASLTSSTSYTDHAGSSTNDNSGFYAHHFLTFYYNYPRSLAFKNRDYSDRSFAQELRLVSNGSGPWDYTVGLYYQDEKTNSGETDVLRGFTAWWNAYETANPAWIHYYDAVAPTSDRDFLYRRKEHFTNKAVFGELGYHLNPTMQVTAGVRVFEADADVNTDIQPSLPTRSTEQLSSFSTKNSRPLFKLNYSWHFAEKDLFYVTASQGFRRGGSNAVPTSGNFLEPAAWQTYGPDRLNNYEVGIKGSEAGFNYSAAVFYIDWKDVQLNTATVTWGYYATTNAAKAKSKGLELELDGRITDHLHYTLGYTYTDATLASNALVPVLPYLCAPPAVCSGGELVIASSGNRLPAAPENTASAALDYTVPVAAQTRLNAHLGVVYQSSTLNALSGDRNIGFTLGGFSLWDAELTLARGSWDASLTVRNLFNNDGITGLFPEGYSGSAPAIGFNGDTTRQLISLPRTVSLGLTYRFGSGR